MNIADEERSVTEMVFKQEAAETYNTLKFSRRTVEQKTSMMRRFSISCKNQNEDPTLATDDENGRSHNPRIFYFTLRHWTNIQQSRLHAVERATNTQTCPQSMQLFRWTILSKCTIKIQPDRIDLAMLQASDLQERTFHEKKKHFNALLT